MFSDPFEVIFHVKLIWDTFGQHRPVDQYYLENTQKCQNIEKESLSGMQHSKLF